MSKNKKLTDLFFHANQKNNQETMTKNAPAPLTKPQETEVELPTSERNITPSSRSKTTTAVGEPLKLAVVGHTNTGKTSILRTLLRDVYFGEVKNAPATTRHVERAALTDSATGETLVLLYDTPGLEDATGLMDWLEDNTASRRDGIDRLQQFLAADVAKSFDDSSNFDIDHIDFSQEAKVIRQLLASDMAIYVIDAREPVLAKYKDELTILSWAAIPVMPVFNFTNSPDTQIDAWQTMLARRNLHIMARFDSVAFEFDDEMVLWQNLATMLTHPDMLTQLMARRRADWDQLYDDANLIIADFLINVAAFVREINDDDDPLPILAQMQEAVRQTERTMQQQLLNLYKFYDNDIATTPLELKSYQQDPFDPELLKLYGIRTTSGAAAGALLGLGIDAAALGTTLGLGAALGGIAGGILSNTGSIADKISGVKRLYIDPATLTLLAARATHLLDAVRHRGHAATSATQMLYQNETEGGSDDEALAENQTLAPWGSQKLPSELKKARSKPQWSSISSKKAEQARALRQDAAWSLSQKLEPS